MSKRMRRHRSTPTAAASLPANAALPPAIRGMSSCAPPGSIARTARNFVRTILRLAAERDRLTIVADQRGCPTAARDVAQACLTVALRCVSSPARGPYGLYHFAGGGEATWHEFARTIVELARPRLPRPVEVVPIRTVDYPTPAQRPADTRLDCTQVVRDFGIEPRPWRTALEETLSRLLDQECTP